MKINELLNELFDVSKIKQVADIQNSVKKLNDFIARNPSATKEIASDANMINTSFASLLASIQAQNAADEQEKIKREQQEKMAMKAQTAQRVGVGSTVNTTPTKTS